MKIGIIGGTGVSDFPLEDATSVHHTTWSGDSVEYKTGTLAGTLAVFLQRHGGSTSPPHELDHKANIRALETEGCDVIIALSACGSLHGDISPCRFAVPDDMVDFTGRNLTFISGRIEHPQSYPAYSETVRRALIESCDDSQEPYIGGTMVSIRGPRFATLAESQFYQSHGWKYINMTTGPEAMLARERGIQYAVLAFVTDYDSSAVWPEEPDTSYDLIKERFAIAEGQLHDILPQAVQNLNRVVATVD